MRKAYRLESPIKMTVNVRRPKDDVRHDHVFAGGEAGERRHNDFEIFDVKCYKYMLLFFVYLDWSGNERAKPRFRTTESSRQIGRLTIKKAADDKTIDL